MRGYNKSAGSQGEDRAVEYLKKQGYQILERNYFIRGGEVDIIALDGEVLVFIEVKARWSRQYGHPLEAVTYFKIKALKKTAQFYNLKVGWGDKPYRIDALSLDYADDRDNPKIELVKDITEF